MSWVAVGVGTVSAIGGAVSAGSASKKQDKAAQAALEEQRRQYDLARADQAPWREAGTNALAQLTNLSGQFGKMPTAQEVMATPGYQFGLDQGRNALEGSAAARGGLYSGAAGKALTQFGTDYGTTKYDQAFNRQQSGENAIWNRYAGLAGIGQTATNQLASLGSNYANNVGQIGMSNANAQGAATIAQGNALQGGLNQAASWWNQSQQPKATGNFYGAGSGMQNYGYGTGAENWDPYSTYADGGPVRETKVGTRSPLRGEGGGGLSRNALLMALQPPPAAPVQPLPGNPLMNPKAIIEGRMATAEGPVTGPGGPRDDMIPAMLSNGEHVVTAAEINALGGGNNAAGQAKMNKLRALMLARGNR